MTQTLGEDRPLLSDLLHAPSTCTDLSDGGSIPRSELGGGRSAAKQEAKDIKWTSQVVVVGRLNITPEEGSTLELHTLCVCLRVSKRVSNLHRPAFTSHTQIFTPVQLPLCAR